MNKITEREICRQLIETMSDHLSGNDKPAISYEVFKSAMIAGGFISSRQTIMTKWHMLILDGILIQKYGKTWVNVRALESAAGMPVPRPEEYRITEADRWRRLPHPEKHIHTHTLTEPERRRLPRM